MVHVLLTSTPLKCFNIFLLQYLCAFVSLDYCFCLFLVLPVLAEVLHLLLGVGDDGVAAGLPAGGAHLAVLVGVLKCFCWKTLCLKYRQSEANAS